MRRYCGAYEYLKPLDMRRIENILMSTYVPHDVMT